MADITTNVRLKTSGRTIVYKRDPDVITEGDDGKSVSVVFTIAGIPYALMAGYPIFNVTSTETTATEKYRIRAQDVVSFKVESFPPIVFRFGSSYHPPTRRMPNAPFLRTRSVTFEPHADLPGDPLNFDLAGQALGAYATEYLATIEYGVTVQENESEISMNAGGQFMSLPPMGTKVKRRDVHDQLPEGISEGEIDEGAGEIQDNRDQQMPFLLQIPTIEYSIKLPLIRNPPFASITSLLGRINKSTVTILNDALPETVLFMGYSATQRYTWDGASSKSQPWSMELHFSQRQINKTNAAGEFEMIRDEETGKVTGTTRDKGRVFGWNHAFNPTLGEWVEMEMKNGRPPYDTADFEAILPTDGSGLFNPELFFRDA